MGLTLGLRLTNQPRPFCVHGLRSSPRREVFPSADGPGWFPPGGLFVTPARRSQADAARAALPLYAARAAQPPLHMTRARSRHPDTPGHRSVFRLCVSARPRNRGWTTGPLEATLWPRLTNQPGAYACPARVPHPDTRPSARIWPRPVSAWWAYSCPPARCSQADAARAAWPPYAARAAQPLLQPIPGSWHREPHD